jgi:hypothetical protein
MAKYSHEFEQVENELTNISMELTAIGDMIPVLLQNYEDIEPHTPLGIKLLIEGIRKQVVGIQKYFRQTDAKNGSQSLGGISGLGR